MAAIRRRCGFGEGRFRLGLIGVLDSRKHYPVDEAFSLRKAASKLGLAWRSLISNRAVQNRWHFHTLTVFNFREFLLNVIFLFLLWEHNARPPGCKLALKLRIQPFTEKPRLVRCWIESNGMTGLVVAIAQNVDTRAVLMQGFANREALLATISSSYSRSRSTLWTKGETSMNFINVCDIFLDCDRDSIIFLGKPDGPTCYTGSESFYYTSVDEVLNDPQVDRNKLSLTTPYSLESIICKRNFKF